MKTRLLAFWLILAAAGAAVVLVPALLNALLPTLAIVLAALLFSVLVLVLVVACVPGAILFLLPLAALTGEFRDSSDPGRLRWRSLFSATRNRGQGPLCTEERILPAFRALTLLAPVSVRYAVGPVPGMTVEAQANMLPFLVTRVENGHLTIALKKRAIPTRRIRVTITGASPEAITQVGAGHLVLEGLDSPVLAASLTGPGDLRISGQAVILTAALSGTGRLDLEDCAVDALRITLKGSGDLHAGKLRAEHVELSCTGSGNLHIDGQCRALDIRLLGAGSVDASALAARSAVLRLTGTGDTRLQARETLTAMMTGSGDLHVTGNPPDSQISRLGPGEVTFA